MNLSLSSCVESYTDQIVNYQKTQANDSQIIKFFAIFAPPFVAAHFNMPKMDEIPKDMVCGAFMKVIIEMSRKYGYR